MSKIVVLVDLPNGASENHFLMFEFVKVMKNLPQLRQHNVYALNSKLFVEWLWIADIPVACQLSAP